MNASFSPTLVVQQTSKNGASTAQPLSLQAKQVQHIAVSPQARITFSLDGQHPVGKKVGDKQLSFKKLGKHLQVYADEALVAELTDFYAAEGAVVVGDGWSLASADSPPTAPDSSSNSAVATPVTPTPDVPGVLASAAAVSPIHVLGAIGFLGLWGGGSGPNSKPDDTPATSLIASGAVTLGVASAGLLVQAKDAQGRVIASTTTDENGRYSLQIDASYAGQVVTLTVTDPDRSDGLAYVDEATGASKDILVDIRAQFVLDPNATTAATAQRAQITPLSELAVRLAEKAREQNSPLSDVALIQQANRVLGSLFGLSDAVDAQAPDVVGDQGPTDNGDAFGQALALLSGMDAVADAQGSADGVSSTLERLSNALTINVSGSLDARFDANNLDTFNLLSQAISEVASNNNTDLIDDLSEIALRMVGTSTAVRDFAMLITSPTNVMKAGASVTLQLRFDDAPEAADLAALQNQLNVSGGQLGALTPTQDPLVYTLLFTQSGSAEPRIWLNPAAAANVSFYSNELSMQLDVSVPQVTVARIEGLDTDANGSSSHLDAGDRIRVVLTASEPVVVTGQPVLQIMVGEETLNAVFVPGSSSVRTLVFEFALPSDTLLNDTDGVTVQTLNLNGATVVDYAGNSAEWSMAYSGPAPVLDTVAPVVISQVPVDASVVGASGTQVLTLTFSEAIRLGSGNLVVLSSANATLATVAVSSGQLSADGRSVSYTTGLNLAAGSYRVQHQGSSAAFLDAAGNALSGDLGSNGWDFTIGNVIVSVDVISTDNLINAKEAASGLTMSGSLTGPASLLSGLTASNLTLTIKNAAGTAQAFDPSTLTLVGTQWSVPLPAGMKAGGYNVEMAVSTALGDFRGGSSFAIDTSTQILLSSIAGDNRISLAEQAVINAGQSLAVGFVAERGASGTFVFQNGDKQLVKTFSNASGSTDTTSVRLIKEDLQTLGSGTVTLTANTTDAAGNTAKSTRNLVIDAQPVQAKVSAIKLFTSDLSPLNVGDTISVAIAFDKSLTLVGKGLAVDLEFGSSLRTATFTGLSADRLTMNFLYKVVAGDNDADGVRIVNLRTIDAATTLLDVSGLTPKLDVSAVVLTDTVKVETVDNSEVAARLLAAQTAGQAAAQAAAAALAAAEAVAAAKADVAQNPSTANIRAAQLAQDVALVEKTAAENAATDAQAALDAYINAATVSGVALADITSISTAIKAANTAASTATTAAAQSETATDAAIATKLSAAQTAATAASTAANEATAKATAADAAKAAVVSDPSAANIAKAEAAQTAATAAATAATAAATAAQAALTAYTEAATAGNETAADTTTVSAAITAANTAASTATTAAAQSETATDAAIATKLSAAQTAATAASTAANEATAKATAADAAKAAVVSDPSAANIAKAEAAQTAATAAATAATAAATAAQAALTAYTEAATAGNETAADTTTVSAAITAANTAASTATTAAAQSETATDAAIATKLSAAQTAATAASTAANEATAKATAADAAKAAVVSDPSAANIAKAEAAQTAATAAATAATAAATAAQAALTAYTEAATAGNETAADTTTVSAAITAANTAASTATTAAAQSETATDAAIATKLSAAQTAATAASTAANEATAKATAADAAKAAVVSDPSAANIAKAEAAQTAATAAATAATAAATAAQAALTAYTEAATAGNETAADTTTVSAAITAANTAASTATTAASSSETATDAAIEAKLNEAFDATYAVAVSGTAARDAVTLGLSHASREAAATAANNAAALLQAAMDAYLELTTAGDEAPVDLSDLTNAIDYARIAAIEASTPFFWARSPASKAAKSSSPTAKH